MKRRLRGKIARAVATCALAASFAGAVVAADPSKTAGHPRIGQDAPPFALQSVAGDTVRLGDLKGMYLVIHFGASW